MHSRLSWQTTTLPLFPLYSTIAHARILWNWATAVVQLTSTWLNEIYIANYFTSSEPGWKEETQGFYSWNVNFTPSASCMISRGNSASTTIGACRSRDKPQAGSAKRFKNMFHCYWSLLAVVVVWLDILQMTFMPQKERETNNEILK